MFDWMAWTTPVAVFFTCIVLMLAAATGEEPHTVCSPARSLPRRCAG